MSRCRLAESFLTGASKDEVTKFVGLAEAFIMDATNFVVPDVVEAFLADSTQRVLRISLEFLSFEHNAREVVVNAVGRYLLGLARQGRFLTRPFCCLEQANR